MSAEAIGVLIALSNPGNRYMSLIAGIAQELVSMTRVR